MNKLDILKEIMRKNKYSAQEQAFVLGNLSSNWLLFEQSREEIEKQLYTSFGLWRGLGNAIKNYLDMEKQE